MSDLSLEDNNEATEQTALLGRSKRDGSFGGNAVFIVEAQVLGNPVNGINALGWGENGAGLYAQCRQPAWGPQPTTEVGGYGVIGSAGTGVLGIGTKWGVFGRTDKTNLASVTFNVEAAGVAGASSGNFSAVGTLGTNDEGVGVLGRSINGTGVYGASWTVGVRGESGSLWGVEGSGKLAGVYGTAQRVGVLGSAPIRGVEGSSRHIGVYGSCDRPRGFAAGFFRGPVIVVGPLTVYGAKSAAVPHTDGTHRLLYAVESPESWFEDFGEARLERGRCRVSIDQEFVSLIRTRGYHVFITPLDDCMGLYVGRRYSTSFDVRELHRGKSNARFSFRIVARRKDIKVSRLASIALPADVLDNTVLESQPSPHATPKKSSRQKKPNAAV